MKNVTDVTFLFLQRQSHNLLKRSGFVLSKIGQDFPVQFYILHFESVYEFAVGQAVFPRCGVDFDVPAVARRAFFLFASAESVRPRMEQGLLRGALFGFPSPAESLRVF